MAESIVGNRRHLVGRGRAGVAGRLARHLALGGWLLGAAGAALANADLVLNHLVDKPSANATDVVTYTLSITNNGPDASSGVVLTDVMPGSTAYVSHTTTQGSCTHSGDPVGGTLSCAIGALVNGQTATVTLAARIASSSPTTIVNAAEVAASTSDPDASNNALTRNVTVTSGTDLQMSLAGSPDPSVSSGGTLTYSPSVVNNGPDNATSVQATITLAPGFSRTGALPSGCSQAGQVVTCTRASLASGGTWNIGSIAGTVSVAGPSSLSTTASVDSATFDGVPANNVAQVDTTVDAGTDVSVTMTRSPGGTVVQTDELTITLTPRYSGGQPQNLTMTATINAAFEILNGGAFTQNGWSCTVAGQTVSCARPNGGGSTGGELNHAIGQVAIGVRAVGSGVNLTSSASIATASPTDVNPGNNDASIGITVQEPNFDLQALKSGPTRTLRVVDGEPFQFNLRVRNGSNVAFVGELTMTDTLPAGLRVDAYTLNGWNCGPAVPVSGAASITCTRTYTAASPLGINATTPSVLLTTTATATGTLTNTMCVTNAPEAGFVYPADSVPANDCAGSGVEGQLDTNSADVQVIKTADASVIAGDVLTYTLEVVNHGPDTAQSVTLADTFASLFTGGSGNGFEGATVAAGNATVGSCTNATAANVASRNLSCVFTALPVCTPGTDCPVVTVQVRPMGTVNSGINLTRNNTATAYSATTSDPAYGNNEDDASTTVTPRADLVATKTAAWASSPNPIAAGTQLTYTLTVVNANSGATGASNVSVSDTLPLDVTFLSASASDGGACGTAPAAGSTTTAGNRTVECTWATLGRGQQRTVTILVRPNHGTEGLALTNTVIAQTDTPEVTLTNNSGLATVNVAVAAVDLATTQTDSPDPLQIGDTVTYTYTVHNFGPSLASAVRLYNALPTAGLAFQGFQYLDGGGNPVAGLPPGVTCSSQPAVGAYGAGAVSAGVYGGLNGGWNAALENADVVCELGDMAASSSITFQVVLEATHRGVYTNHVIARSQEQRDGIADINPANDREPENTTVRVVADMEVVSKTVSRSTVSALLPFNYTIVVRNNGPNEALEVRLVDDLPDGMELTAAPTVVVNNGSFETPTCSGAAGAGAVACEFGAVSNGAMATVTLPVRIIEWTGATLGNTAIVSVNNLTFDTDPTNNSKDVDVAVQRLGISGRVFQKADPSQPSDPFNLATDAPLGGVAVTVSGNDVEGNPVNVTLLTDPNGNYSFDLPPSDGTGYRVTRGSVPMSVVASGAQLGTGPAQPGTVSSETLIAQVILDAADGIDYDFWVASNDIMLMAPTVSGYVYFDRNRNRVRPVFPEQDPLVRDWTVSLWAELSGGGREKICELQTDAYGFYQFDNVRCASAGYDAWRSSGLPVSGGTSVQDGSQTYTTFTVEFASDDGLAGLPQSGGGAGTPQPRAITGITVNGGSHITEQNLPLDPAGVIYDAITRQPVRGALVFFEDENGFAVDPACLLGGINPVVTTESGLYQFLLDTSDPACAAYSHATPRQYRLRVVAPAGYLPAPSTRIPACDNALEVGAGGPFDVQAGDEPPAESAPLHDPLLCPVSAAGLNPVNQISTQYYFRFNLTTAGGGASGDVVRNHIPLDPVLGGAITIVKTSPLVNVTKGQLVPYTITATNTLGAPLTSIEVVDQMPPGFRYRSGSASVRQGGGTVFVPAEPEVVGRTMRWAHQSFQAGEVKTFRLVLMVGAGAGEGEYTNLAWAANSVADTRVSNVGSATVRIVPDPLFDCSDIIGKVFDDRNANGYQDDGEPGIPNVRVVTARGLLVTTDAEGRFHVVCADIPQRDRGSNFVMKLDERTLPSGYRVTTENPRDVRVTRGKMVKLNFGATIHKVYRVELDARAFDGDVLLPEWSARIADLVPHLYAQPSVVRLAYALGDESEGDARRRLATLEAAVLDLYRNHEPDDEEPKPPLTVEQEVIGNVVRAEGAPK